MKMTNLMSSARFFSIPVLMISVSFATTPLQAGTWVKSVQSCEKCAVQRGNEKLRLVPLMELRKGDLLKIAGEEVKVVLVDSSDRQVTMDGERAEFEVTEEPASISFPQEALDALDWFRTASSRLLPGGSMLAAGDRVPPLISGMDADGNQIPATEKQVVFAWDFGQPPFTVRVLDPDGNPLIENQTDKQKLLLQLDDLARGKYRFELLSTFEGEGVSDSYPFSIVDTSTLPGELAFLDTPDMPATIRTLLRGVLMARYPQWRFMALQMAIRVKDRPLARVLLEEESH